MQLLTHCQDYGGKYDLLTEHIKLDSNAFEDLLRYEKEFPHELPH